jgi:hypothetical protein
MNLFGGLKIRAKNMPRPTLRHNGAPIESPAPFCHPRESGDLGGDDVRRPDDNSM